MRKKERKRGREREKVRRKEFDGVREKRAICTDQNNLNNKLRK